MRQAIAAGAGKAAAFLSRRLNLGGGTTFPGQVARRIDPRLLAKMSARLEAGCLLVTGTNGKTTTAGLIAHILRQAGLRTVHNHSGANLLDGVTSALLSSTNLLGSLPMDVGVLEVDEATVPQVVAQTRPRALVITNLFRDQLDRYGEIDYVAGCWRLALAALPPSSTVILNADDPLVASLGTGTAARVVHFGLEDTRYALPQLPHTADSRRCLACGAPYRYQAIHYSHLGHYACPSCGAARPTPTVYAREVLLRGLEGSDLTVSLPGGEIALRLGLPGLYNVSNALAALACCWALGVRGELLRRGSETFAAALGRIERLEAGGRQVLLALVKNPVGFDEVLRLLLLDEAPKDLLIVINDHIADGTDISWLWDVDLELLAGRVRSVVVSGTRAEEMRLRLKYAGVDLGRVVLERERPAALQRALAGVPAGGTLYVLPTYTALLEVRQAIEGAGQIARCWQE